VIGVSAAGPLGAESGAPSRAAAIRRDPAERDAWISLASVPGVGPVTFKALVRRFGSAAAALDAGPKAVLEAVPRGDGDSATALQAIRRLGFHRVAERLQASAAAAGGRVITALDGSYPARLARLDVHPPVLYVVGDAACLQASAVAIVGTRRASGYGRAVATEIADELARVGVTIVSGLAIGIDGAAHEATLDAGGRTAAVLPSPIDRIYPPRHRNLAARVVEAGGAVLSEAPPGRVTGKPDFARRNRIISGLADAVVVVEAPDHSGALLTAAAAIAQGRDLFAVPGPIDAIASRGSNRLIADHLAELVTSPVSLVHRLGMLPVGRSAGIGVADLSETEGLVLAALMKRSASIEELLGRTSAGTAQLASALTLLEARGLVASYGGVTFHPTLAAKRLWPPK
jgi:DNA processing protein